MIYTQAFGTDIFYNSQDENWCPYLTYSKQADVCQDVTYAFMHKMLLLSKSYMLDIKAHLKTHVNLTQKIPNTYLKLKSVSQRTSYVF